MSFREDGGLGTVERQQISALSPGQVFAGAARFTVMEVFVVSLLVLFPRLVTWLPHRMLS